MRVLTVGADSLTTARVKNGRIIHVVIDPNTVLADSSGTAQSLWGALSTLIEGDLVHINGVKDSEQGVLRAQRVVLDSRALQHKKQKQGHGH